MAWKRSIGMRKIALMTSLMITLACIHDWSSFASGFIPVRPEMRTTRKLSDYGDDHESFPWTLDELLNHAIPG